jgi:sugar lactone lactonase YvrE
MNGKKAELAVGEFEPIASGVYVEGLTFDFKRNVVWYSDPIGGGIHGVSPDGEKIISFNEDRMWSGGVLMNDDGAVLSTGEHGIMWNHPDTGRAGWLLNEIDGQPINGINEMMPDGTGGIYFGTIDLERVKTGEDTRPTALYRLTVDRQVRRVSGEIGFTNGIMYDAGRKRFYCSDTFHCTWVFDVDDDLTLRNQAVLLDKTDSDGMALDAEGNIWITGFRSQFLERVAPDGRLLPRVRTPEGSVTQVRFGGAGLRDYYICVVPAGGGDTLKEGGSLEGKHSFVYRGRAEVPGMPIAPAKFRLE